jgi:hypothetical protein
MKGTTINKATIISTIVAFILGFVISRAFIKDKEPVVKEVIKYVRGDSIHDTISTPVPYAVYKNKIDTFFVPPKVIIKNEIRYEEVDTMKLLADYYLERNYNLDFSNDTLGVYKVETRVNQNRLVRAVSTIVPNIRTIEREKTIYKSPALQFYGILGSSVDLKTNQIQFGIDFKNKIMIGVSGIRLNDSYGYTINAGIKF